MFISITSPSITPLYYVVGEEYLGITNTIKEDAAVSTLHTTFSG